MRDSNRWRRAWEYVKAHPDDAYTAALLSAILVVSFVDIFVDLPDGWIGGATLSVLSALGLLTLYLRRVSHNRDHLLNGLSMDLTRVSANVDTLVGRQGIAEIANSEVGDQLDKVLGRTTSWKFKGGAGRWQRTRVMPALAAIKTIDVQYDLHLVDPADEQLCRRYDEYRAVQRVSDVRRDGEKIREEILACIYAAAWYGQRSRLRPHITLTRTYSPLRTDVGDGALMLTVADRSKPGLLVSRGTWLYDSLLDEFSREIDEAPKLVLPEGGVSIYPVSQAEVTGDHLEAFVGALRVIGGAPSMGASASYSPGQWGNIDYNHVAAISFPLNGE